MPNVLIKVVSMSTSNKTRITIFIMMVIMIKVA